LRETNSERSGKNEQVFQSFTAKFLWALKGRLVIPAEARKSNEYQPRRQCDHYLRTASSRAMINIVPEDEFNKFLKFFEEHVTNLRKAVSQVIKIILFI